MDIEQVCLFTDTILIPSHGFQLLMTPDGIVQSESLIEEPLDDDFVTAIPKVSFH